MSKIKNIEVTSINDDGTESKLLMTLEQFKKITEIAQFILECTDEDRLKEFPDNLIELATVDSAITSLIDSIEELKPPEKPEFKNLENKPNE